MIRLALLTIAIGSLFCFTGCTQTYQLQSDPLGTPAYSSTERFQHWQRSIDIDLLEMNEDIDEDVLMVAEPSEMTIWNIR
jgi:hypothetical protein